MKLIDKYFQVVERGAEATKPFSTWYFLIGLITGFIGMVIATIPFFIIGLMVKQMDRYPNNANPDKWTGSATDWIMLVFSILMLAALAAVGIFIILNLKIY